MFDESVYSTSEAVMLHIDVSKGLNFLPDRTYLVRVKNCEGVHYLIAYSQKDTTPPGYIDVDLPPSLGLGTSIIRENQTRQLSKEEHAYIVHAARVSKEQLEKAHAHLNELCRGLNKRYVGDVAKALSIAITV